jgi:hypothetical protein
MYPPTIAIIYPIIMASFGSDKGLKIFNPGVSVNTNPINKVTVKESTTGNDGIVLWNGNLLLRKIMMTALCVNRLSKNHPV